AEPSAQPHQCGHAPALAVAAVRKVPFGFGVCAVLPTGYLADSELRQPATRKRKQVSLPTPASIRLEIRARRRIAGQKGCAHLIPHLEVTSADAGPQPGAELPCLH